MASALTCTVALVQTSSASVERLFSVLKLVVDAIGNSMLEETLGTRLFVKYKMVRHASSYIVVYYNSIQSIGSLSWLLSIYL
jgi:hypothetical protein